MTQHNPPYIDIQWLMQRCSSLYEKVSELSHHQMAEMQQSVSENNGDQEFYKGIVDRLFESLGLQAAGWVTEPSGDALPMVALLPHDGCRIVYGRTAHGTWLLEGPAGNHELTHIPEESHFAGIHVPNRERPHSAFDLFREALSSRKRVLVQAGLASVLCNVLALATSLYSLQVYDRVVPTQGIQTLIVLTTGAAFAIILQLIVNLSRSIMVDASLKGMDCEIAHGLFRRLMGIRIDQFPASVGTLSSQIRGYETIRAFAWTASLYVAVDAPFAMLFLLVIMAIAGPLVALVALVFFLLALVVGLFFRRRIELHTQRSTDHTNRKLGLLVDSIEGAESLKATGAGWQFLGRWDSINRQAMDDEIKIRHASETSGYMASSMQQLSYIGLVCAGAYIAANTANLTTGGIVACSILSGRVLAPIGMLPGLIVQWGHAKAALSNLEKLFKLERDNHDVVRPLSPESLKGRYQIRDLHFSYQGRPGTLAIEHLVIEPGEKIGILGVVGAGKSTLLKMLAGLYKPQQGHILLDGLDLQQISRLTISGRVGYLPQNVHLFAGTVRDNLLLGISGVSEQQLLDACEITGLMNMLSNHPRGLDMVISEGGAGVSVGQKQLIAITRLILAMPDICLLDEPTASMDEGLEHHVMSILQRSFKPEQTLVLVTHKPAMLRLVERIIILTPSGIAMDGPRDDVLERLRQNTPATTLQHATCGGGTQ